MLNTSEGINGIKLNLKSLAYKAKFIIYENYQVPPADHNTLFECKGETQPGMFSFNSDFLDCSFQFNRPVNNGGGNERYTNDDLKGLWKQLTAPDYLDHYCNLMKCKYLMTAPQGCTPEEDVLAILDVPVELKFSQITKYRYQYHQ
uniref:Uncharacterized protein n=1 Tax=Wuchereria bancrofti TaxID=6293 RepID=A0AAF5PKS4_WUCBA